MLSAFISQPSLFKATKKTKHKTLKHIMAGDSALMAELVFITTNIWTAIKVETFVDKFETKIVASAQSVYYFFSFSAKMIDLVVTTSIKNVGFISHYEYIVLIFL